MVWVRFNEIFIYIYVVVIFNFLFIIIIFLVFIWNNAYTICCMIMYYIAVVIIISYFHNTIQSLLVYYSFIHIIKNEQNVLPLYRCGDKIEEIMIIIPNFFHYIIIISKRDCVWNFNTWQYKFLNYTDMFTKGWYKIIQLILLK